MTERKAEHSSISRAQAWLLASRPKTLPASLVPVIVGSAVAVSDGAFAPLPAAVALICALLIQIGANFANDYYDFLKGADTDDRIGPARVVQSGLLPPAAVRTATILVFCLAFILGLYLVHIGGLPILIIGIVSIACAALYTAGPMPLAYIGAGDFFVFFFFGIVAVTGTHYVQALRWSGGAFIASLPIGAISTAILVVNNYRDIETDRKAGKRTLAVRMGKKNTRTEFKALLLTAYAIPIAHAIFSMSRLWLLLPLLSIPLAVKLWTGIDRETDGSKLNKMLADTGRLLLVFGILYSAGIILS